MGRTFEVLLKQANVPEGPIAPKSPLAALAALPTAPAPPKEEGAEEEEVPFIEIGPHRSMEASASVLATAPPARPAPAPKAEEPPRAPSVSLRPAEVSPARSVAFRPLAERQPRFPAELVAYHSPGQPVAEPYRELLAALLPAAGTRAGTPALLFSGAAAGVGATTVLLNVAITAAQQGQRVVVVDANLRAPAIADRLGLERRPGLRDLLAGSATIGQALQQTEQAGLLALTAGEHRAPGPEVEPVRSLLRLLRLRFDLVLVDGPAWDGRPDVIAAGAACDAVYLVVAQNDADAPAMQGLQRQVREQGGCLAGCVLTNRG